MVKDKKVSSAHGNAVADKVQEASVGKLMASRKKQFKGVRMRSWGSWVSEIRAPNQKTRIWLGSYSTPEAAARAYDAAVLCLKGSSANLNFPINPSIHIPSTLMSPKSIKRVAAAAANATTLSPSSPPPPPPTSSSTSLSSPSTPSALLSPSPPPPPSPSSPLEYQDQHFTSSGANHTTCLVEELSQFMNPWIGFGDSLSPKCIDQMLDACSIFEPLPQLEECFEEDIRLWSFC